MNFIEKNKTKTFKLNQGNNTATITYKRLDNNHNIIVPYNRRQSNRTRNLKVFSENNKGERTNITQQPGIPYFISGKMLGSDKIIVKDTLNNKERFYDINKIIDLTDNSGYLK